MRVAVAVSLLVSLLASQASGVAVRVRHHHHHHHHGRRDLGFRGSLSMTDIFDDLSWDTQQLIKRKTERYRRMVANAYKFYAWNDTDAVKEPCESNKPEHEPSEREQERNTGSALWDKAVELWNKTKQLFTRASNEQQPTPPDMAEERCDKATFVKKRNMTITGVHVFPLYEVLGQLSAASAILPLSESSGDSDGNDRTSQSSESSQNSIGWTGTAQVGGGTNLGLTHAHASFSHQLAVGHQWGSEKTNSHTTKSSKSRETSNKRECPAHNSCSRIRLTWYATISGPVPVEPVIVCGRHIHPCAANNNNYNNNNNNSCPIFANWAQPMCLDFAAGGHNDSMTMLLVDHAGNIRSEIIDDDNNQRPIPVSCDEERKFIILSNGETYDPDTETYYRNGDYSKRIWKSPTDPLPAIPTQNPCKPPPKPAAAAEEVADQLQQEVSDKQERLEQLKEKAATEEEVADKGSDNQGLLEKLHEEIKRLREELKGLKGLSGGNVAAAEPHQPTAKKEADAPPVQP